MLEKLLHTISRDGTYRSVELARKLGVSAELLEQMMADLIKAGYLRPVEGCCDDQCCGCSQAGDCGQAGSRSRSKTRMWTLDDRLRRR